MRFGLAAALVASATAPCAVDAATISQAYSETITLDGTDNPGFFGGYLPLNSFDPAFGTLRSVTQTVHFTYTMNASWDLTQVPPCPGCGPGYTTLPVYGQVRAQFIPDDNLVTALLFPNSDGSTESIVVPTENGAKGFWSKTVDVTRTATDDGSLFGLGGYIGTGQLNNYREGNFWLYAEVLTGYPLSYSVDGTMHYDVRLDFNYEPAAVPEPATWAMMILGFGAAGIAARRRRAAWPTRNA